MIKKLLFALAMIGWFVLVFIVSWWLTFPSESLAKQAEYRVQQMSSNKLALDVGSVGPWWMGTSASDVKLMSVSPATEEASVVLTASTVRTSVGLFSLIQQEPSFSGTVYIKSDHLNYSGKATQANGNWALSEASLTGRQVSMEAVSALLAPMIGDAIRGQGKVDIDLDVAISGALNTASGRMSLSGKNLNVILTMPDPISGEGTFELGPFQVSNLDLDIDIENGRAVFKKGRLNSTLANVVLGGNVTLRPRIDRSQLRLTAVISDLGEDLKPFESLLKGAEWDDGKYHYAINCAVNRMNNRCIRPETQRRARNSTARPRPTRRGDGEEGDVDEEREKRRNLRREERLNRMRDGLPGRQLPQRKPQALEGGPMDKEQLPLPDEELPMDDEEILPEDLPDDLPEEIQQELENLPIEQGDGEVLEFEE